MKTAKKKVSPFEFVIMQYADPEGAKQHEPYTSEELLEQRKANIRRQIEQIDLSHVIQNANNK